MSNLYTSDNDKRLCDTTVTQGAGDARLAAVALPTEVAPKNWTDLGLELRCDIAPRMVRNQGDKDGEHTKEAYSGV
jgi:hypothetical protein